MRKNGRRPVKRMALLLAAMLLSMPLACAAEESQIEEGGIPSLNPRLPQSVTEYTLDFESKEWLPARTWTYTYENAYPVLIDCYEEEGDFHTVIEYQYEFEGDLPVKRTSVNEQTGNETTVEYVKGRPYNVFSKSGDGRTYISRDHYQYANGDDYFTLFLHEHHSIFPDDPEMNDDAEEVDSVSVTSSNGLLVRTVNTGMYANWAPTTEKEWLRFNGTYSASYDGDGIVDTVFSVSRVGRSGVDNRFEAYREDGLVREATVLSQDGTSWSGMTRYTFEYTDTEISAARYATMINSFLMGEENNWYRYLWY